MRTTCCIGAPSTGCSPSPCAAPEVLGADPASSDVAALSPRTLSEATAAAWLRMDERRQPNEALFSMSVRDVWRRCACAKITPNSVDLHTSHTFSCVTLPDTRSCAISTMLQRPFVRSRSTCAVHTHQAVLPRTPRAPSSLGIAASSASSASPTSPTSPTPSSAAGATRTIQLTPVPLTAEGFKPFGQVRCMVVVPMQGQAGRLYSSASPQAVGR